MRFKVCVFAICLLLMGCDSQPTMSVSKPTKSLCEKSLSGIAEPLWPFFSDGSKSA